MRLIFALALTFFATLAWAWEKPTTPIPESEWSERTVEAVALLKSRLFDEDSAKIRILKQTEMQVCGEVNGKNQFGGYVGYQGFAYYFSDEKKKWEMMDATHSLSKMKDVWPTVIAVNCKY